MLNQQKVHSVPSIFTFVALLTQSNLLIVTKSKNMLLFVDQGIHLRFFSLSCTKFFICVELHLNLLLLIHCFELLIHFVDSPLFLTLLLKKYFLYQVICLNIVSFCVFAFFLKWTIIGHRCEC